MDEFKPITTQEELDAIIKSRLERERNKFADYDQLKTSATDLRKALETARSEASAAAQEASKKISELEKQNKAYATAAVKTRIALEYGIPSDIKDRLCGETEEEIKADAERIAPLFANRKPPAPPLRNPEPKTGDPVDSAWRTFLDQTKEL